MDTKNIINFYNQLTSLNQRVYKYKLNDFKKTNDIDIIKEILKTKLNIHINNNNNNFPKKFLLFEKKDKLYFYTTNKLYGQYIGHILILNILNDNNKLKNFPLSILNVQIKPIYNNSMLYRYNIKDVYGMACNKKTHELPFIFYYIVNPKTCSKTFSNSYQETTNYLVEKGDKPYSINKLLFRGSSNNDYRKHLFIYYKDKTTYIDFKNTENKNNFIDFEDYSKYKYILDINGINGHRARTIYMFFLNRVLFLPIDDPNKLFYEKWKNPPKPNIHFVPYSLKNLDDFEDKVKYYENNPDKYNEIQQNCAKYAKENLTIDNFYKYIVDLLNKKIKI